MSQQGQLEQPILNEINEDKSQSKKPLQSKQNMESFLRSSQSIEIYYEVEVIARVKKEDRVILKNQQGLIPAGSFTAILGPSGSGKTTLLNFLSGRLVSNNLKVSGKMRLNSELVESMEPYSSMVGYVMQQDSLLAVLTPRECFSFAGRLKLKISKEEVDRRVDSLINELGLDLCKDTRVGSVYLKGLSGGERKRTSIGVELINNPGLIFLDEPTTGLDSATALQTVEVLKRLALQGKTVLATIHQPSSELFCQFDKLMLLVEGRCIYLGKAEGARNHFETQGYKCPPLMNASEYYLDLMSLSPPQEVEEGQSYAQLAEAHEQKMLQLETAYTKSALHVWEEDQLLRKL